MNVASVDAAAPSSEAGSLSIHVTDPSIDGGVGSIGASGSSIEEK
jgi:hypothetical protein